MDSENPKKRLEHDDYTVCWICPLEVEQIAARIMLDEEHERLSQTHVDHNVYNLGSINGHNVIIASLHAPGNNPTATVITQLKNTFKGVRFCLLVGIGGGVPVKTADGYIQLGHVVVSKPTGIHSGAVQYDHGKAVTDGSFQRNGYLHPPPAVLLNAAQDLAVSRASKQQDPVAQHMQRFNTNIRGLRRFKHPGREKDMLFPSSYQHLDPKVSCKKCGCDKAQCVQRGEEDSDDETVGQDQDESWIVVHRGTIASGESVMKDGVQRDRLADDIGAVCFEMEAAGAMMDFPCLVIRGIADYCDSHKNDNWHGYAAAVAAAYARQLFFHMPVDEVKSCTVPLQALNNLNSKIDEARIENRQGFDHAHFDRIRAWLKASDVSTNYNRALEKREEGTGLWLIESSTFETWKTTPGSFLWLYGNPGCGKTVLSSSIINACQLIQGSALAYFLFDFNNSSKQSEENILRSLLVQLAPYLENGLKILDDLFSSCNKGTSEPSKQTLLDTLIQLFSSASEIFVVVDALDECPSRDGFLESLRQIMELKRDNLHMIVTSRPERDIETSFDQWLDQDQRLNIQSDVVDADIRTHVAGCLERDKKLNKWANNSTARTMIEDTLMKKAAGMFQWVACQLDELRNCHTLAELSDTLASLPETLDDTYERLLRRIDGSDCRHILRILQWLLHSERPLGINELAEALAVRPDERPSIRVENRFEDPLDIFAICSGLIVKSTPTRNFGYLQYGQNDDEFFEVQLSHFSVKEYLISDRVLDDYKAELEETYANASIAETCLAYLMHFENNDTIDSCILDISAIYPLLHYASSYWPVHTKNSEQSHRADKITDMALRLLLFMPIAYDNMLEHLEEASIPSGLYMNWRHRKSINALYLASYSGLVSVVTGLLQCGVAVDAIMAVPMITSTALMAASTMGEDVVVSLLIEAGAEVNQCHGKNGTPLQAAVSHIKTVETLLHGGADVNHEGCPSGTALQAACNTGSIEVCKALLESGAIVNAEGEYYGSALQAATERRDREEARLLVQILLQARADVNTQGGYYGNALQAASCYGNEAVVQILLQAGADVNMQGGHHGTALQAAAFKNNEAIVRILLKAEADINPQVSGIYGTPLHAGAVGGSAMVEVLLSAGANINARNAHSMTALHEVVEWDRTQIAGLLLSKRADANAQNLKLETPLHLAAQRGHLEILNALLEAGSDLTLKNSKGGTPLHTAAGCGQLGAIEALIEAGSDLDSKNNDDMTPLDIATYTIKGERSEIVDRFHGTRELHERTRTKGLRKGGRNGKC